MSDWPDYEAMAINLWYQDGNTEQFADQIEKTRTFYLDRCHDLARFLLGDTVLFVINVLDEGERVGGFLKVWPLDALEGTDK